MAVQCPLTQPLQKQKQKQAVWPGLEKRKSEVQSVKRTEKEFSGLSCRVRVLRVLGLGMLTGLGLVMVRSPLQVM